MDDEKLEELFGKEKDEPQKDTEDSLNEPSSSDESKDTKEAEEAKESKEEKKETPKIVSKNTNPELKKVKKEVKTASEETKKEPLKKQEAEEEDKAPVLNVKAMVAIVLGTIFLILVLLFILHPTFRIRKYEINGNHVISDQEIIDAIGLDYNDHFLKGVSGDLFEVMTLRYGDAESDLLKNPYIIDVTIKVKFPSTVVVDVTERSKIACISIPDGYIAIDPEGVVLEMYSNYDKDVGPLICGLDIDSVVLGEQLDVVDDVAFQKMIIVLGAILVADGSVEVGANQYSLFDNLNEVRILPSGIYFLTINMPGGSVLQVKLNEVDSINDKMQWLLNALENDAFNGLPDGVLDMTGEKAIYHEYD